MTTHVSSPPGQKILLVDDQPINLQAASSVLHEEGYNILVARDGQRALHIANTQHPDLILLDVVMPELDGYTVCRSLKDNPETANIPVIFLTAMAETNDVVRGFEVGGVDYVAKPFQPLELKARVRTHLDLVNAHNHLRDLNELKSQFLAMAAHDLKNPIHAICGFTQLILMEVDAGKSLDKQDDGFVSMLKGMERSAVQMTQLIHDLLESEAISAGMAPLNAEEQDLDQVLREVIGLNYRHAASKGISLHYEPTEDCLAWVDKRATYEIFDNLVNNAVKYSPTKSSICVQLTPQTPDDKTIRFSVRDQGPGITEEDMGLMFGKFQKLSARPTGGESSSGLGLSIVKSLVEQQGGTISVTSAGPGKGATFIVDLPIKPA